MDLLVCIFIIELLLTNSDLHDLNNSQGFFYFYLQCLSLLTGTAVITTEKAALWTDGRYFLQAEKQLDENWILMKDGELKKILHMLIFVINTGNHTKNKFMNSSLRKFCFVFKINTMKLVLSSISFYLISTCQTNWNISEVIGIY